LRAAAQREKPRRMNDPMAELKKQLEADAKALKEVKSLAKEVLSERDNRRKKAEKIMNGLQALILAAVLAIAGAFFTMRDDVIRMTDWVERTDRDRFRREDAINLERRLEAYIRAQVREHEQDRNPHINEQR